WRSRSCVFFFFFQAEGGIRDRNVTGVQTCALPILPGNRTLQRDQRTVGRPGRSRSRGRRRYQRVDRGDGVESAGREAAGPGTSRSEERRVGKERITRRYRTPGAATQQDEQKGSYAP